MLLCRLFVGERDFILDGWLLPFLDFVRDARGYPLYEFDYMEGLNDLWQGMYGSWGDLAGNDPDDEYDHEKTKKIVLESKAAYDEENS